MREPAVKHRARHAVTRRKEARCDGIKSLDSRSINAARAHVASRWASPSPGIFLAGCEHATTAAHAGGAE